MPDEFYEQIQSRSCLCSIVSQGEQRPSDNVSRNRIPNVFVCPIEAEGFYHWDRLIDNFRVDHVIAEAELKLRNFVRATFGNEIEGVEWKIRVGLGGATEQIITAALQEEADLIVMARSEKAMLVRLFTHSISEAVSSTATCPVLTIDATRASPFFSTRIDIRFFCGVGAEKGLSFQGVRV
jgi:hypothetical protein